MKWNSSAIQLCFILGLVLSPDLAQADSVKPYRMGPFFSNSMGLLWSPTASEDILTNGHFDLYLGWSEPIYSNPSSLFHGTYLETNAQFIFSPYQTRVGTAFHIKPMRYFEIGLTYHHVLFNHTMNTYPSDPAPSAQDWKPGLLALKNQSKLAGADVFSYQANLTFDIGPLQIYSQASRSMWDIESSGDNFIFEQENDILLKSIDHVDKALLQVTIPVLAKKEIRGIIRNEFWQGSDKTNLRKNLLSAGFTGLRFSSESKSQKRGVDILFGIWTTHPQIAKHDLGRSWTLLVNWNWDFRFLNLD